MNWGGDGDLSRAPSLEKLKKQQFGSVEMCAKDFKATASMRGIGWVIMYQDIETGLLFNQWINEHDVGHPAGLSPLLILDVFEHAFMTDYGLKKADYIEAFFKNVKWEVVEQRLETA
jgi:Fe-Mn family superoxide dismutase